MATYNQTATRDVELTHDYSDVTHALNGHTQYFYGGSTNIGGGIEQGVNVLSGMARRPWAIPVIVLLTDGIHYSGLNPLVAADTAKLNGVTIYTVTFSDEADQAMMSQVADDTGGVHFHASTAQALLHAFEEIAKNLPTLLTH